MAQIADEARARLGPACGVARFYVGSRAQVWGDTALMVVALLGSAFLSRALRHHWSGTTAIVLLVVAVGTMGGLFLRQLLRGERGWMFYSAMLLFGVMSERRDTLVEAQVAPIWIVTLSLLAVAPAVVGIIGSLRIVQALDEMWRQINYRALAFAFIATLIAGLAQWLLTSVGIEFLTWWRLPLLMAVFWGVGMAWAYRRLR